MFVSSGPLPNMVDGQGEEITCVFCESGCQRPPTERAWLKLRYSQGIHLDCIDALKSTADGIKKASWIKTPDSPFCRVFAVPKQSPVKWGSENWSPAMDERPIHAWFSLTRSQYLTIPRLVLDAMDRPWQSLFVNLLMELDRRINWRPEDGTCYRCQLVKEDEDGQLTDEVVPDPLRDYNYGHALIKFNEEVDS